MGLSMPSKNKKPKIVVTRQFLMDLADDIYNTKTRKFLRLCNGTLQNGPDPVDACRPMHCGLGELYFRMTGRQPKADDVWERAVINTAVELSVINGQAERRRNDAEATIKAMDLPKGVQEALLSNLSEIEDDELSTEKAFREALGEIPSENDAVGEYRQRAVMVARQLRHAATLLPA